VPHPPQQTPSAAVAAAKSSMDSIHGQIPCYAQPLHANWSLVDLCTATCWGVQTVLLMIHPLLCKQHTNTPSIRRWLTTLMQHA
jgi:hypothetical protein